MMKSFKVVKAGGSHYEIGLTYGKECKYMIQYFAKEGLTRELSGENVPTIQELEDSAMAYEPYIAEFAPHLLEEIRGIGEGAKISYRQALMLQCRGEILYKKGAKPGAKGKSEKIEKQMECSSFALNRSRSAMGRIVVGQNLDLPCTFEELGIILHLYPDDGPSIMTWTLAGTLGQVGLNSYGLGRCGNALICPERQEGLPTTITFRRILEMKNVAEVINLMIKTNGFRAKSNNFVVGDREGVIVDIETIPGQFRLISAENGIVTHTNHYLHPDFLPYERYPRMDNSRTRLACLRDNLTMLTEKIDSNDLKPILRSHQSEPYPLCVHSDPKNGIKNKTIASIIMDPETGTMEACPGCPCENEYVKYTLKQCVLLEERLVTGLDKINIDYYDFREESVER